MSEGHIWKTSAGFWTWEPDEGWASVGIKLDWNAHGGSHGTQADVTAAAHRALGRDAVLHMGEPEPGWVRIQREAGEVPETDEDLAVERLAAMLDSLDNEDTSEPPPPPAATTTIKKPFSEWLDTPWIFALAFARMGRPVFPCYGLNEDGTCQCRDNPHCKLKCGDDASKYGKHPIPANGHKAATTNETQIRRWIAEYVGCNWGNTMREGDVVIDIDPRNGGVDTWYDLIEGHEEPAFPTVLTGNDGLHYYARGNVARQGADALGDGVDLKAFIAATKASGYVLMPGSRTTGGVYAVLRGGFDDPPELPEFLHPTPTAPKKPKKPTGELPARREGSGNVRTVVGAALAGPKYALGALRREFDEARVLHDGERRRDFLFDAGLRMSTFVTARTLTADEVVTALANAGVQAQLDYDVAESHVKNGLRRGGVG